MAGVILTDEQVEQEIQELQSSEFVKLAAKYGRVKKKRRMYLYYLRQQEKAGRRLAEAGVTIELLSDPEFLEMEFAQTDM